MVITGDSIILTLDGASLDVFAMRDDDPTWQHSTVPSSEQAPNNGSQYPEWIEAILRASGFSENVTAWQPLVARRRTSLAARSTSKRGRIPQGMNRPG